MGYRDALGSFLIPLGKDDWGEEKERKRGSEGTCGRRVESERVEREEL